LFACAGKEPTTTQDAQVSQTWGEVSEDRVINETKLGDNWLVNGGNFGGEHNSPLDQINTDSVNKLGLAWSLDLPSALGIQAEPIVVDGVAYLTGTLNQVYAIDAASGKLLWQFDPELQLNANFGPSYAARVNRGVAVWEGMVYLGTADCRMVAIDASLGTKVWESTVCGTSVGLGAYITSAPRVGGGMVFSGYGGSEFGVWGSTTAFDAKTGEELWRFWTLPRNPEEGDKSKSTEMAAKTWTDGWAKYAGGTVWDGIRYDPVTGFVIFGTSAPGQMNVKLRDSEGRDNLFTSSVVAVDAKTGEYAWHYQANPADAWNYDANMNKIVTDIELNGESRRVVFEAGKNGFLYMIDAHTGKLLAADPLVEVSWASHVDMETGRPIERPGQRYYDNEDPTNPVRVTPTDARLTNPMSYSPETKLLYIPVAHQPATYSVGGFYGAHIGGYHGEAGEEFKGFGKLIAWDPVENRERWSVEYPLPYNGGTLSTAGNLVFHGTANGLFQAYSADAGRKLWSFESGSAIGQAGPVSYKIGDEQYVMVSVGGGSGIALSFWDEATGKNARGPTRLLAFKLGGTAALPPGATGMTPVPRPPEQKGSPEQIAAGAEVWTNNFCEACHGISVVGRGERVLDGAVPDLRYMPPEVHQQWHGIVLGGTRHLKGMLGFSQIGMTMEDSEALYAYVVEQSWKAYNNQQQNSD